MSKNEAHFSSSLILKQMLAGGIAGMLADAITYPLMTVKSRMQVQGSLITPKISSFNASNVERYAYKGTVDALLTIGRREGWKTLYKGFTTVIQVAPAQALYMGTYQASRIILPGERESPLVEFSSGILATLGQSLLMVPLEVVRQRQQVQTSGTAGVYLGSVDTARKIISSEGPKAFFKGFWMTQVVWGPFNAVYLPLWESTKRFAVDLTGSTSLKDLPVQYELGSSFFSSAFAAAVTNPMDVVKTRLQVQGQSNVLSSTKYSSALDAFVSIIKNEGFFGLTRGTTSRVLWVAPSTMIMFTSFDQIMKLLH